MIEYLLIGCGFAFAAAVQPGPLQAFLLSRVAESGWKHTLPAALSPLVSDGPVALVVLVILGALPGNAARILQGAGGVLLLFFAARSYRQARAAPQEERPLPRKAPTTILQAAAVNLLNPNPYLGWALVLGPAVMHAWSRGPVYAAGLLVAFYVTMVLTLAATIVLFGTTRFLGAAGRRALIFVSAVLLAALGVYQLAAALFFAIQT